LQEGLGPTPDVKILQAFEIRKDCAQEALETDGWCPNEAKGRGGSKRVDTDESYAWLRKKLKFPVPEFRVSFLEQRHGRPW
jgi:hypothetical protein